MTRTKLLTETQAREEICRVGKSLFERGYVHATAGNISVRLDEEQGGGFLITPTDSCLGFLDPAELARLDASGQQISGQTASKTIALHQSIYRAIASFDHQVRCIVHTHSSACVQLTLTEVGDELLPPITPYYVMKVGRVPVLPYQRPGAPQTVLAAAQVIEQYGQRGIPLRALMLARLGPNVWHANPAAAMATLEELEETARLWLACKPKAEPLSHEQITEIQQTFGVKWHAVG